MDVGDMQANVVLLDIHGIFIIMRKRYETIGAKNSVKLAAKATREILNNIVDDYAPATDTNSDIPQKDKLPALLIYLATSAEILGLVKSEDYINSKGVVEDKCSELYQMINDTLMKF